MPELDGGYNWRHGRNAESRPEATHQERTGGERRKNALRAVRRRDVPDARGLALSGLRLQDGLLRLVARLFMAYQFLSVRRDGPVAHLTLNRPDVRNAFNEVVIAELTAWADAIRADETVRVAVIAGAGPHFCAGADIAWMRRMGAAGEEENRADARRLSTLLNALDTLPVPLVARIHGAAIAGGTGLAAVSDIVVAAENSTFGFTEVRLGILPAVISPFSVAKIGVSAARELFLTGARFSAARARELGLVHAVVPEAALDSTVEAYIRDLLAAPRSAIASAKAIIKTVAGQLPAAVAELTSSAIARQRMSPDGQEGLAAFLEKRPPSWSQ
jgi:methylglutaconyl-CoA hydratase